MATFSLEIPDEQLGRVFAAFCANLGWPASVPNPEYDASQPEGEANPRELPNPETPDQFARRMVIDYIRQQVVMHEGPPAADAALEALRAEVAGLEIR